MGAALRVGQAHSVTRKRHRPHQQEDPMSQPTSATRKWIQRIKRKITPAYYELVYGLCTPPHVSCMNYGYAPITEVNRPYFPEPEEGFQYELYWQAFHQMARCLKPDEVLCEISCGRGGGLAFLRRLTPAHILGLERSSFARHHARSLGLEVRPATAPYLPLPEASIDVFLSIEAAHNYHNDTFVAELRRCLKPGGVVLLADMNLGSDAQVRHAISRRYRNHGLIVRQWRDIRPNVLDALHQDETRKLQFLHSLPRPFRAEAKAYMGMVGSHKYHEMQRDERAYFMLLAQTDGP